MNRLTLLNVIERVRKHVVCAYVGDICDCKYGAQDLPELNENRLNWRRFGGEQNGCCEMREIIFLLKHMTDREHDMIVKRGQRKAVMEYKMAKKAELKEI